MHSIHNHHIWCMFCQFVCVTGTEFRTIWRRVLRQFRNLRVCARPPCWVTTARSSTASGVSQIATTSCVRMVWRRFYHFLNRDSIGTKSNTARRIWYGILFCFISFLLFEHVNHMFTFISHVLNNNTAPYLRGVRCPRRIPTRMTTRLTNSGKTLSKPIVINYFKFQGLK